MLFLVVLAVTVVTTMATTPMEETSTQVTSVETAALLLVTTVTVALEEMPLEVGSTLRGCVVPSSNAKYANMSKPLLSKDEQRLAHICSYCTATSMPS